MGTKLNELTNKVNELKRNNFKELSTSGNPYQLDKKVIQPKICLKRLGGEQLCKRQIAVQPDAKEPGAVLKNILNLESQSLQNEQGNKIDSLSRGAEQKGGGSQQEDAEGITREVQEAGSGTPGAQRSAREIETARQRT